MTRLLPATQGLSRMNRNHIHLAQGIPSDNVISGMLGYDNDMEFKIVTII